MKSKLQEQHSELNIPVYLQRMHNTDNSSLSPPADLASLLGCRLRRTTQARVSQAQCPHSLWPCLWSCQQRCQLGPEVIWTPVCSEPKWDHQLMLYMQAPKQLSLSNLTSVGWVWTTDLEAKGSFMLGLHKPEFLPLHFLTLSLSCPDKNRPQTFGKEATATRKYN